MLSVSDTGTGIPADAIDRVVEPFYTTKEAGSGTGLGLSMVHGFVVQSKGHMRIYSELGHGTTVKIYLPRHVEQAQVLAAPKGENIALQPVPRAIDGETVLLVEDDDSVREYAVEALEDLGYRVLAAKTSSEAIRMAESNSQIDVLFTDVVLGGSLNGKQLADQIVSLRPPIPVLFTTGYTRNAIVHHGRLDAGVNLLNKPYTQRDVGEKIRRLLDQSIDQRGKSQ